MIGHSEPDVVMACCGDVPTMETLAAVSLDGDVFARTICTGGQRGGSHEASTNRMNTRMDCPTRTSTRSVHEGQADYLSPFMAIPG